MLNEIVFLLCAAVTLVGAVAAMMLRNLVHCALCAAGAFAGLAAIYLQLDAEFVGFAQVLIYVGAIAILIVFAVLLTRGGDVQPSAATTSPSWWVGLPVAALVVASLIGSIMASPRLLRLPTPNVHAPVKQIGEQLMNQFVMPLETVGLLLTAALLGAVVIGLREPRKTESNAP
ncbi:MAG TPA: NADH-quinone oxidoreductase subunit J [Verrucomicrobiae bacterium]|jgi:NADH-quinone oxidoreductase subunit J|nr:NADH-quinone oxidoreductase subunit J [Verrucomicrobiae bacterium]